MKWFEFHLEQGADMGDFYDALRESTLLYRRRHHFFNEPWNPGAFVVRVETEVWSSDAWLIPGVKNIYEWDAAPDEALYGPKFDLAMEFFEAGSRLNPSPWEREKFVHCFLNAQGMSWGDEVRFHLRVAYKRVKLMVLWKPVYERRFREQQERENADREARRMFEQAGA